MIVCCYITHETKASSITRFSIFQRFWKLGRGSKPSHLQFRPAADSACRSTPVHQGSGRSWWGHWKTKGTICIILFFQEAFKSCTFESCRDFIPNYVSCAYYLKRYRDKKKGWRSFRFIVSFYTTPIVTMFERDKWWLWWWYSKILLTCSSWRWCLLRRLFPTARGTNCWGSCSPWAHVGGPVHKQASIFEICRNV